MSKTQSPIATLDKVARRRGAAVPLEVLRSEGLVAVDRCIQGRTEAGKHAVEGNEKASTIGKNARRRRALVVLGSDLSGSRSARLRLASHKPTSSRWCST